MAIEVTMPQMGADMQEGTLLRWLKHPGEQVARGEAIAEIETDKANVELESFEAGILERTLVAEGAVVPVGTAVALIGNGEGDAESPAAAPDPAQASAVAAPPPAQSAQPGAASEPAPAQAAIAAQEASPMRAPAATSGLATLGERRKASPLARNVARELGVDLGAVQGSGPDGRIVRRDVDQAARTGVTSTPQVAPARPLPVQQVAPQAGAASFAAGQDQPLSRMRSAIARRMADSKRQMPHYYVTIDVDMTEAMTFREQVNRSLPDGSDMRVSVNDLIVRASALALRAHPEVNAVFGDESIHRYAQINVCIAVAMPEGLMAPALLDTADKTLGAIAREAKDVAARARAGSLRGPELNDGTFTVSNLGMYGIETLIPIIQPGQGAILGVGAVTDKPAVHNGEIAIRKLMSIALAADHRVTDGAQGAEFIREIKTLLENPFRLVL